MPPTGNIDRKKHEVDITERVLEGGLWAAGGHLEQARVVELSFDMRGRPMSSASTIEVRLLGSRDDDHDR